MFLFLVLILPSKSIEMFNVFCCNRLESFYSRDTHKLLFGRVSHARSRDTHQRYMLTAYDKDSETCICFSSIYSVDM